MEKFNNGGKEEDEGIVMERETKNRQISKW